MVVATGKAGQRIGVEIAGVLLLLGLTGLVDLVAGGDDEAHIGVSGPEQLSRVRFQPKASFRAAVLAAPASARQGLAALGLTLWRRRSGGRPHTASLQSRKLPVL